MRSCLSEKEIDELALNGAADNVRHLRSCAGCRKRLDLAKKNLELLRELQELDASRERIRGLISESPTMPNSSP